jgi:hypothetical protein
MGSSSPVAVRAPARIIARAPTTSAAAAALSGSRQRQGAPPALASDLVAPGPPFVQWHRTQMSIFVIVPGQSDQCRIAEEGHEQH